MKLSRLTLPSLFAAMPVAMLFLSTPTGCILNDDFLKVDEKYACTESSDCSEPGYKCQQGFCTTKPDLGPPCTTADQDLDGDGYGSGTDRKNCPNPELDLDDTCAECTPESKETCDGKDNNTDGTVDESIACGSIIDCPINDAGAIPMGTQWSCEASQCTVVPQKRGTPECANVVVACTGGVYDTAEAATNNCL